MPGQRVDLRWVRTLGVGAFFVLVAGGLGSCGGGDDGGTQPPPPAGNEIGPEGGTATSGDGLAQVSIPAGALTEATTITVGPAGSAPAGAVPGTAHDFGPDGTQFQAPVTVTLAYDPADLPGGTMSGDLMLCRAIGGNWTPVLGAAHDDQAHTLSGQTTHFSTYGIVLDDGGGGENLTAYLVDVPDPGSTDQFATLAGAMAWLESELSYEDTGTLVWDTSEIQSVDALSYSFDLEIQREPGAVPHIQGPPNQPLVINAAGAIDLAGFFINAQQGLVINANRAMSIQDCDLPDEVVVNLGGVKNAPFPAGDPSFVAGSPGAAKRSRGTIFANSRALTSATINIGDTGTMSGDIAVTGNETQHLNLVGESSVFPQVSVLMSGHASVPTPYPYLDFGMGGSSTVTVKDFSGFQRLKMNMQFGDEPLLSVQDVIGGVTTVKASGPGKAIIAFNGLEADSTVVEIMSNRAQVSLVQDVCRAGALVTVSEMVNQLMVKAQSGTFTGGLTVEMAGSGQRTVDLQEITVTEGNLVVTAGGEKTGSSRGAVSLNDVVWNGSAIYHVDLSGLESDVTVSGGTFTHSGSPAVSLGLSEITGAVNITDATFNGAGVGIVDCSGGVNISGLEINVTSAAAYGLSMGGGGQVTVSDCQITGASGGVGVLQVGAMNGAVSVTNCELNGALAATLATFAECSATLDNNPLLSGAIFMVESDLHVANNTFSGTVLWDDYQNPGLQNDPVADNDGLLPGDVYTRMDWDGNGCCDYPPEWNETDEHGACTVCTGVGGKQSGWR